MKINIKLIGIIIIAIAALLSSCSTKNPPPPTATVEADYITFTHSRYVTNDPDSAIVNEFWYYDSEADETKKIFEIEYTSQYPLGHYDKVNNLIYYTKSTPMDHSPDLFGDQIFVTDLNTNEEKQLTTDLFAVNYIIPADDQVFFVAVPQDSNVLRLGAIDRKTGEVSYWGNEDTINDVIIETISVNQSKRKIYVSTYSDAERNYNLLHQDGPVGQNNYKMPLHTVYEIDYSFEHSYPLYSEYEWIRMLMTTDYVVTALSDKQYNEAAVPSTLIQYSLVDDTIEKGNWDTFRLENGGANYSSDGTKIYAIATINQKRGLYEYALATNTYREIFIQTDGFINNMQVVKYAASPVAPLLTEITNQVSELATDDVIENACPDQERTEQASREDNYVSFHESEYENFYEYLRHYIPAQMEPSTLLTYGENNEPMITKLPSGRTNEQSVTPLSEADSDPDPNQQEGLLQEEAIINKIQEEASCLPVIQLGFDLPNPEPGLAVIYGTDGFINRIYYENEQKHEK